MTRPRLSPLAALAIGAGLCWAVAFAVIALPNQLEFYGDGAMFSYAVAARDVWAFHWHNIAGRTSVYLLTLLPGEWLASRSPWTGIELYGFLFYVAPLAGLVLTYLTDRSPKRPFFVAACASTALLCPLIFGFPTEMWLAHALFWPVLALSHTDRRRVSVAITLVAAWLLLAFTHEGALVLLAAILATLTLHGWRSPQFMRGATAMMVALMLSAVAKIIAPPDDYYAGAFWHAAFHFFDPTIFKVRVVQLLLATIAIVFTLHAALWKRGRRMACALALVVAGAMLLTYWLWFDDAIHASDRYYLRTFLVVALPVFGCAAAWAAYGKQLVLPRQTACIAVSLFVLITAIHLVETVKFLSGWHAYRQAVTELATGGIADPALGDPRFVSSARLPAALAPLSWFSTTPYLSVLLADFSPRRLVIDPDGNYFWLSCATATRNRDAPSTVLIAARELVRVYSCQHRPS